MRYKIRELPNRRLWFTAIVAGFSFYQYGRHRKDTILLTDVRLKETGELLTDHMWKGKGKWAYKLEEGEKIKFMARRKSYKKGYRGRINGYRISAYKDWTLARLTQIEVIK